VANKAVQRKDRKGSSNVGIAVAPEKTEQQVLEDNLLDTLAALGGQRITDDSLIQQGNQLVLPATMSPVDAIRYLEDHIEQQEEETRFTRTYKFRPWDGASAVQKSLIKVFGTAGIGKPTWTFFGKKPPEMRAINVGPTETMQVPWGQLAVPLFGGKMFLGVSEDNELGQLFVLTVDAPRKYRAHIEGLFRVVQQTLESESIYKGQAIDGQEDAEFLDLSGVDPRKVVYSDEVLAQLDANLWSVIRHTDVMRRMNIPRKRAVLLEGPYGTGKTLGAFLTAQVAVPNGWTFIYCRPTRDSLATVMATARLYQPAIVFFEDVDILAESGDRDAVARLLDLFDGITAKGTELMLVLTTNHKERIHRGMVRPGRLDAMIHIGALDLSGITRMIEATAPQGTLDEDIDYEAVYEAMEGFLPAFVKEAIDRTLRYAISRSEGEVEDLMLTTEDFVLAASGLRPQLDLMNGAGEGKIPDPLGTAMRHEMRRAVDGVDIKELDGATVFRTKTENGGSDSLKKVEG
jgi:hypothetical protein